MEFTITILHVRAYKFAGRDGEQVTGFTYGGKTSEGKGITFTSQKEYAKGAVVKVQLRDKWDEQNARLKYSEII